MDKLQDSSKQRVDTVETSSNSDQIEPYQREDSLSRISSELAFLSRTNSRTGFRSRYGSCMDPESNRDKNSDNHSISPPEDNFTRKKRSPGHVVNSFFFTRELNDLETLESDERSIHSKIQEPEFSSTLQLKKNFVF